MAFFNFRWPGKKDEAESVAGAKRPSRLAQGESVEAMRRRARHRLIGAAVLVLIGVVGFPLLFDTQPRPIPVNIPIEIPDQANSAPEVVPGARVASQAAAPSGRVAANASLDDGEEVLAPSARPAAPAAPAASASAPAAPAVGAAVAAAAAGTAAAVTSQVRPEPKPDVKPQPKPEPKPERKPEPKPEKPKAEVKPEVKSEIKKPEAKPEPRHKPEAPKVDEAARARALLEGRSTSEAAPAREAAATNERFIVQIGAFAEVGKANEIKGKLGAGAFTQTVDTKDGKRTRVRMGPFKSREEAEKAAARAKALGLPASVFKA
ncbi:SPOR domain-containing protein [Comamonas testosteroni]|uniref:SPOR domain-containing protein n=1 Tax=Comamonas testosteroni TaxID=285 RepID=UPI0025CCDE56|nr:SPOR domain-containing protein [Comamonas testosteroni]MEB5967169.1 SPOR domain-containing protein [Comamonas testosteroni]